MSDNFMGWLLSRWMAGLVIVFIGFWVILGISYFLEHPYDAAGAALIILSVTAIPMLVGIIAFAFWGRVIQ